MESASGIATDIRCSIQDMAYDSCHSYTNGMPDDDIDKLEADGVTDIVGCLADSMWNDTYLLADLMGDRVYDACCGNIEKMKAMYIELRGVEVFKAWQDAVDTLIERWS